MIARHSHSAQITGSNMINKKRLVNLTQQLIRINSQNPPGDESRIAAFIKEYLHNIGLKPKIVEFKNKRPNILAVLKGENTTRSLMITPHLDTVPSGRNWRVDPFCAKIINGRIYGLGATDCKGNLGCALEVMQSILESRITLGYDLIFCATADEESGSDLGLIPLLDKKIIHPDAAIVLDADDFEIVITQKGLIHLKVKIQGKRAHGAYPWKGINAIDIAVDIIKEIRNFKFLENKNRYLKKPTVNVGTIRGGDKVNVVADWCEFELDFRFLPGDSEKAILSRLKKSIRKYTAKFKIEIEGIQKPYLIEESHPLISCLSQALKKFKLQPKIRGSEGATTITFFQNKNIPAIATGFGCSGCAHISDEYVKIDNLYKGASVLEEFLKNYRF